MKLSRTLLIIWVAAFAVITTSSCKKGRNLPVNVPVYIDTTGIQAIVSDVYLECYDMNRKYITEKTRRDLVVAFHQDLQYYLKKNNCIKGDENAEYIIKVNRISLVETISTKCYVDSCATSCYGPAVYGNVYMSKLTYSSDIHVYKRGGQLLGVYNELICKKEKTRGENSCNKPNVRGIIGPNTMRKRVTKSQRRNITKAIHFDWKQNNP